MSDINKTIRYVNLLSIYGELLSSTQKDILSDYYEYNLSLSEIGENRKISRAAVDDAIKKGMKKLDELENTLELHEKLTDISLHLDKLKKTCSKDQLKEIEEIERIIK